MHISMYFIRVILLAAMLIFIEAAPAAAETREPTLAELKAELDHIRAVLNNLDKQIKEYAVSRGLAYIAAFWNEAGPSTLVAGSKSAVMGHVVFNAVTENTNVADITVLLNAPEDNSQKGLRQCYLKDGADILTAGINPTPSKSDAVKVVFPFVKGITIAKGAPKILALACDVTPAPEGPASYVWQLGGSFTKKTVLIREGSFVVEVAAGSPAAREVRSGSQEEIVTVFDFYAAGEAVELQTLALQVDGEAHVLTGYTLWDGARQVGGGTLRGEPVFKAAFSDSFIILKDEHKFLTVKGAIASVESGGVLQAGDQAAINFDGSDNNFHLTYGLGVSSGRGIIPSTQADTNAPFVTLAVPAQ